MSNALRSLGALADGISQGLVAGEQLATMRGDRARRERADNDAAAVKADLEEANGAARAYLQGLRPKAPAALDQYLTQGGTDGSMPDQTGIDAAPQAQPWQPSKSQLLRAAEARTNHLFAKGRVKEGVELWAQDERMRAGLRQEALATGLSKFKATGDATDLIRGVYENVDDGWDIQDVKPAEGGYSITRVNQRTGKTDTRQIPAAQLDSMVESLADPKQVAMYSLRQKLAAYEAGLDRETAGQKHNLTLSLEEFKSGLRRQENQENNQSRERVAETRADATVKAAGIRKALTGAGVHGDDKVQSIKDNADGTRTIYFRSGKKVQDTESRSLAHEALVGRTAAQIAKTIEGSLATPEANQGRARNMLPKAPEGLPEGLPAGSKKIGTSGGKPVYQTPDGKKFILE